MIEKYLPKTYEGRMAHIAEECAEVIMAYAKMQRFGANHSHPISKERNIDAFHRELKDLKDIIEIFEDNHP
ncbi:MAG: hypothetical protein COA52_01380 [Hyphomicrobiales bacterium]|nr:MAG: hypothetical protein COA52_00290 [Hyphomicrobiales bacterium]PCJ96884.1 MAG: hypothetical protein COA52_01380 [Hyphomicrobiales bacterium]